jgi:hypothetical protein
MHHLFTSSNGQSNQSEIKSSMRRVNGSNLSGEVTGLVASLNPCTARSATKESCIELVLVLYITK